MSVDYSWIPLSNVNLGIDVSRYQMFNKNSEINAREIASNRNLKFVVVRAGISWGYKDPYLKIIWAKLLEAKRIRESEYPTYDPLVLGTYHVIYPGQSIVNQYINYKDAVEDLEEMQFLSIDLERILNQKPDRIRDDVENFYDKLKVLELPIILYTRNFFLYYNVFYRATSVSKKFSEMPMWFAHYGSGGEPRNDYPTVTFDNVNVIIHQFTDHANAKSYGFEEASRIDLNRVLISNEEFYKIFGINLEGNSGELTLESLDKRIKAIELTLGM